MPPRPPWHARAAQIRKDVETLRVPVLDRYLIEQLFGIERRTAQRLLRTLEGHVSAQTAIVTREAVLVMLDDLLAQKPIAAEAARKQRLAAALEDLEQEAEPKATPIATITVTEEAWPEGVSLSAPDALSIRFTGPENLLGRILALTELAAADYAAFAEQFALEQEPGA